MPRSGAGPNLFQLRVLAAGGAVYAVALALASIRPDPIRWGLHLPGFLGPLPRAVVLASAAAGAFLLCLGAWGVPARAGRPRAARPSPRKSAPIPRPTSDGLAGWLPPLALTLYGALLYALRAQTQLLGDGIVWLNALQGEQGRPFSEPLASILWTGFATAAGAIGLAPDPRTYAILPVLCGVASAAFAWGIAGEGTSGRMERLVAWGLILTAGFTQLYFGYIESYPIVATVTLAVIWLALRHARGVDPPWLLGAAISAAIACHLVVLALLPAYAVAVVLRPGPAGRKIVTGMVPLFLAPALLLAAGTTPENWLEPFRTAATGSATGVAAPHLARPYAALSLAHASDVLQALLLAIPMASLALVAAGAGRLRGRAGSSPEGDTRADATTGTSAVTLLLGAAALPGLLLVASLMLPVAPAQDWDLTAVLLVPTGIAGSLIAARLVARNPLARAGALALSAAALLSFVLVNAGIRSGVERFALLVGPGARVSPYGLGYGNSVLSEYLEDRGDLGAALEYADRALQAEPTNARFWLRSGTLRYKLGRYDEAQADLEESIRRGTTRSGAHYNLGLCYVRKGQLEDAVAHFRTAVDMEPDRPDYRHNLGLALYTAGRTDSARVVWTEVIRRWPEFTLTARSMARRFGPASPTR